MLTSNQIVKTNPVPSQVFQYNQVILVPERLSSGVISDHKYFCIDVRTSKMIKALAKTISIPPWRKATPNAWDRVKPNSLLVSRTAHGWLAYRKFRSFINIKMLGHLFR
jgi:hypothetical protein